MMFRVALQFERNGTTYLVEGSVPLSLLARTLDRLDDAARGTGLWNVQPESDSVDSRPASA